MIENTKYFSFYNFLNFNLDKLFVLVNSLNI
jgi:hypothetical protein